jgi:hypothetical protein
MDSSHDLKLASFGLVGTATLRMTALLEFGAPQLARNFADPEATPALDSPYSFLAVHNIYLFSNRSFFFSAGSRFATGTFHFL